MKMKLLMLLLFSASVLADTPPPGAVKIKGGTDGTLQGNVGDSSKVNVTNSISVALPSGAATSALQNTGNTSLASILSALQGPLAVTGTFFQATQPVSGPLTDAQLRASAVPVSVSNFPGTQPISGTVAVSNFPATQPISAAALPLPSGAATSSLQSTINTTLGSPFQAGGSIGNTAFGISGTLPAFASTPTFNVGTTNGIALDSTLSAFSAKFNSLGQKTMANSAPVVLSSDQSAIPVTGTFFQATQPVSGTFFQATQPVSAASLPLPTNAAQETGGHLATIDTSTASTATNTGTISSQQTSGAQKSQRVDGSGNVSPAGDVAARGVFVKPTDGTNSQGYTASSEAKVSVTQPIPAGTNLLGKVGIDQTTPGTTNGVQVNAALPAGTNSIGTVVQTALATGSISNNAAITTAASTFTAPANAIGFILEAESGNTDNIRWAVGSTATASVGMLAEPGRDSGYIPLAANISVIAISGTQSASVQWVVR